MSINAINAIDNGTLVKTNTRKTNQNLQLKPIQIFNVDVWISTKTILYSWDRRVAKIYSFYDRTS